MNQYNLQNIVDSDCSLISVSTPPIVQPAVSNSSLSSKGEEQVSSMTIGLPVVNGAKLLSQPTNISTTSSSNSHASKRNFSEALSNHHSINAIPSVVCVVSHEDKTKPRKKPRTVSLSSGTVTSFTLAMPEDSVYLNPLHCFVRKNIECFVATAQDIAAPCPGRKNSVVPGQIGLRCLHYRYVYGRRTKRAVCYLSSVSRVYYCVSDMKFDHFSKCEFLPHNERRMFDLLKVSCSSKKRGRKAGAGSFNTAQYYNSSALKLGLTNSLSGIVKLSESRNYMPIHEPVTEKFKICFDLKETLHPRPLPPPPVLENLGRPTSKHLNIIHHTSPQPNLQRCLLAAPNDELVLSPIHCFVRKNVEVFRTTPEDNAAPAPGRKTRVK